MTVRVVVVPGRIPSRYVVSAVVHLALVVLWAWAPARTTKFKFEGSAMAATLVAAPPSGGGAARPTPPATPVAPPPAPVPPPEPKGPSLQEPKKPDPKPDKKDKKKEAATKQPPSETPPHATPGTTVETPSGPAAPGTGAGGAGAPGTTLSIGGGQPGSDFYSASVRAAIEPRWRKPVLDSDVPSDVTVAFEILRDGTVRDVQVVKPSGIPALDRSAMRAVIEASPLPPFPVGWRGASTPARMTFILLPE